MLIAVAIASVLTFVVYRRQSKNATQIRTVQIVAAARDLPAGVALAATDVNLIPWPATVPLPGSFTKLEDVAGRPLIYPLGKGEPVMTRDLAIPGSGIGLSVKIPAGMRATSVRSNEVVGVAGFLYPGSTVDVLGTFTVPGNPNPITETLLQNVQVLTAGTQIEPDPTGKPQTVNVVTLLLSPEDSQKLLMASTQSTIQFVLRNGADQGKENVRPTRLDELIAMAKPSAPAPSPAPGRHKVVKPVPPTPPPSVYVVEVIQGQTRNEQKFSAGTPQEGGGKRQ
jgi:pilus assembly protein CpaB